MKVFCTSTAVIVVALASGVVAAAQTPSPAAPQGATQSASAPVLMRVDGQLKTPTGDPRTGAVLLVASVYATQTDSAPLWLEQQVVTLDSAGRYMLVVGATQDDGMPKELFLTGAGRWLGVAVQGEVEQPRIMFISAPYAIKAREADTLSGKASSDFVLSDQLKDSVKAALKSEAAAGSTSGILGTANRVVKFGAGGAADTDSTIFDNGNIGIGTTVPIQRLSVSTPTDGDGLELATTAAAQAPSLRFTSGIGNSGARNWLISNNYNFFGDFVIRNSNAQGGNPYSSGTDRLVILGGGNVGLGTTSPSQRLSVTTPTVGDGIEIATTTAAQSPSLRFTNGLVDSRARNWILSNNYNAWGDFVIRSSNVQGGNPYSAGSDRLAILSNGNVGLGTTAPSLKLSVTTSTTGDGIEIATTAAAQSPSLRFTNGLVDSRARNWAITNNFNAFGDFVIRSSTAQGVDPVAAGADRLAILSNGNVGIGTTNPTAKLHVAGDVNVDGNIGAKYQDVAEWVETSSPLEPGTVVIVDPLEANRVLPASRAYDTRVAGAVSAQPGLLLGERGDTKAMVAQSGRVRVKVDAKYGAIEIGSLLVTSPTPGYAMRSRPLLIGKQSMHRPGTLLGKALEALPSGKGEILVLLTVQ